MRTKVLVLKKLDMWWLQILIVDSTDGVETVGTLIARPRLIDVLDLASSLKVHVDNDADLPLHQFKKVE